MTNNPIVRIAPSPTGYMHVGTARAAIFNWLFAKNQPTGKKGKFLLRIEDTDKERSYKKYEESILSGLEWLGLDYDGKIIRQSERGEIYKKYIKQLMKKGDAFFCYHTKEELLKERKEQEEKKEAPRHTCKYKFDILNSKFKIRDYVIRFNNPGGHIEFEDLIRGKINFDAGLLGDFSIAKNENAALYNFAVIVDDFESKITHVIRGEDHISNTPKQIILSKALGFNIPEYGHLPLILGPDKSKLSKRHGAASLMEYKKQGYSPEALFNFLALLGWNPGGNKEIMSREEIIEKFDIKDIQKSGAVFNIDKLNWMNGEYIRRMSIDDLTDRVRKYLPQSTDLDIKKIVELEQSRMAKFSDIREATEFFFKETLEYDRELLKWKDMNDEELKEILEKLGKILNNINNKDYTKEKLEKVLMIEAEKIAPQDARGRVDRGKLLWPLRVALSGRRASPGPFEIAEILGKQKSLTRLREAVEKICEYES